MWEKFIALNSGVDDWSPSLRRICSISSIHGLHWQKKDTYLFRGKCLISDIVSKAVVSTRQVKATYIGVAVETSNQGTIIIQNLSTMNGMEKKKHFFKYI